MNRGMTMDNLVTFRMDFVRFLIIIPFLLGCWQLIAQQTLPAAGGEATGSGGSASYSIGQVFYQSFDDDGGTVSEGVQQPFEIAVINSLENYPDISLIITAYPNPVTDNLMLVLKDQDDFSTTGLSYQLVDMSGRVIQNDRVVTRHTRLDMANLPPAVYFLKVTDNFQELKTFKIIKN